MNEEQAKEVTKQSRFRLIERSCENCAHNVILMQKKTLGCIIDGRTFSEKARELRRSRKYTPFPAWQCVCDFWERLYDPFEEKYYD